MSLIDRLAGLLPARRSLHIHLAPQRLLAVVRQGGRIVEGGALQVDYANPAGQWQAALTALRALLAQPETPNPVIPPMRNDGSSGAQVHAALAARMPLNISLSGRWCQMVLAPWSDALLAEPGAGRFLRMQLSAVYGDAASAWAVVSDDAPYGQPRVACGIATELLDALHALAAEHGTRCAAIEPLASTVCRSLPCKQPAFAIIEQGRMTLAALAGGRIATIQSQPCGAAWHTELPQAWQRWSLRAPELAAVGDIAVVDLSGRPGGAAAGQLPGLFRLADSPFGSAASAAIDTQAGAARAAGLPLSIVGGSAGREAA